MLFVGADWYSERYNTCFRCWKVLPVDCVLSVMVHGTFATIYIRDNYRNLCHLLVYDGRRTWMYGVWWVELCC